MIKLLFGSLSLGDITNFVCDAVDEEIRETRPDTYFCVMAINVVIRQCGVNRPCATNGNQLVKRVGSMQPLDSV